MRLACVAGVHLVGKLPRALAVALERVYGTCHCAGARGLEATAVVSGGRLRLDLGAARHGWPLDADAFARLERALVARALATFDAGVALHAASFVCRGRLVVAIGRHGAGKSTLLLAARRRGGTALGDDILLVDPRGRSAAFPRALLVKRGRLTAEEASVAVSRGGVRYLPPPCALPPEPSQPTLIFLRRDARVRAVTLMPVGGLAAYRGLLGQVLGPASFGPTQAAALAALVQRAGPRVFRARYGEAQALLEVLEQPAPTASRRSHLEESALAELHERGLDVAARPVAG